MDSAGIASIPGKQEFDTEPHYQLETSASIVGIDGSPLYF